MNEWWIENSKTRRGSYFLLELFIFVQILSSISWHSPFKNPPLSDAGKGGHGGMLTHYFKILAVTNALINVCWDNAMYCSSFSYNLTSMELTSVTLHN